MAGDPRLSGQAPGYRLDRRAALLALFAFALALQGARGIWDPDEGRYTNVALRMVEGGDWLTPALHHEVPHFTKPPLTYWAIGGALELLGRNEWAARLPNALAFAFTVLLVHRLARRLAPGREQLAAVVHATSLFPFVAANIVTTDTLLTLWTTLAVAGFADHRFVRGRPRAGLAVMGLGFGLAFLTKGPPGLLPVLPIWALALRSEGWRGFARLHSWRALALFALVGLGWFAVEIALWPDLLGYLLGAEVAQRVTSDAFDRNGGLEGLARAYLAVLPFAALPWLPWALRRALAPRHDARRRGAGDPAAWFLGAWLLLPFAVLLLSSSRQPLYLLQLTPAASLAIARLLPADALAPPRRRAWLGAWLGLLLALKGAAALLPSERDGRRLAATLARALPHAPAEIVVVQRKPAYSLSFYFDVEVERIALESIPGPPPEPAYRPVLEPLSSELADPERGRIWLVPKRAEEVYLRELEALGWHAHPVGEVEGLLVFDEPEHVPVR